MKRHICILLASVALLAGCYNQKKATQQVSRAAASYPDTVASILRAHWPCITTAFDSSEYVKSREDMKGKLLSMDSMRALISAYQLDAESLEDALNRMALDSATKQTCKQLIEYADKKQKENDRLTSTINQLSNAYAELGKQLINRPPIIKFVEDSAKVYAANRETQSVRIELAKVESKRDMWKTMALVLGGLLFLASLFIFILLKRKR